jgi:hypothetical protein
MYMLTRRPAVPIITGMADEDSIAKEAAKTLGVLTTDLYRDILQPAKEVGQQLIPVAQSVKIAVTPFSLAVWSYDSIKEYLAAKLTAKLANKDPNQIKSPDMVTAGPLLLNMAFTEHAPHLRELYANLLASAIYQPSAPQLHPSFVHAIQQLSADEALILQLLGKVVRPGTPLARQEIDPNRVNPDPPISSAWKSFCEQAGVRMIELAEAYYNNLLRLGIIAEIAEIGTRSSVSAIGFRAVTTWKLELTAYGDAFLKSVVRSEHNVEQEKSQ